MKVVNYDTKERATKTPLLPLIEDPSHYVLDKNNSVKYSLRTVPADANCAKYVFQLRILIGTESPRTILKWRDDVNKVITGLNLTTLATMKPIAETGMRAQALQLFHQGLLAEKTAAFEAAVEAETDALAKAALQAAGPTAAHERAAHAGIALNFVVSQLLPKKVLARVKRTLRRETRKPKDMTIRAYYQHLLRINYEEIPKLPPFRANQELSNDEILDIILFGTPKSWQKEMERQGFDPMEKGLDEVISFMENIEATEEFDDSEDTKKKSSSKSSKKGKPKSNNTDSGELYCMLHGKGNHASEDCHKLKDSVKRLKGNSESKSGSSNGKGKTDWKAKAKTAEKETKDMGALLKQLIKKQAPVKKRKVKDFNVVDVADALKDFNYEKELENLSIGDSDSESTSGEISC